MTDFSGRLISAVKLDSRVYEEVEHDKSALGQSFWVVVLSSVAAGIGTLPEAGVGGIFVGTAAALLGWVVWACLPIL